MKDSTLLKISLICALVGILILFIINEKYSLKDSKIGELNKNKLDEKVKVKGYVTYVNNRPSVLFVSLKDDTGNITIVVFKEENIELKKGDLIEVEGKLTEYNGKLEINADVIRKF